MDAEEKRLITGGVPRVTDDVLAVWRLIYQYHQRRLESTYADFMHYDDLRAFFFNLVYVDPALRPKIEKRDRAFVSISRNWLLRAITSKELIDYLETVIELRRATDKWNVAMAEYLIDKHGITGGGPLEEAAYRDAVRAVTTRRDRTWQRDGVLRTLDLCSRIVNEMPFRLNDILRFTPKFFLRNADLIHLCVEAYHVFYKHRTELAEFDRIIRERETVYIESLFSENNP